jgi:hypothetical protein
MTMPEPASVVSTVSTSEPSSSSLMSASASPSLKYPGTAFYS